MRKLIAGILMLVCSLSTAASALSAPLPAGTVRYRQDILNPNLQNARRWEEEERRRKEEEQRRLEEERRRKEEEKRRQDEQRRQEDERRRQEDERRRQEDERRRQDEERRRREDERRRQEEERRLDERRGAPEARPPHNPPPPVVEIRPRDHGERLRAKDVLRETGDYLIRAQQAARRGHYYFGLGKAYAHQEEGQQFYRDGRYRSATSHSMRARQIARDVIEANRPGRRRPGPPPKYDDEIDNELSIRIRDDKAVLSLRINL